MTATTRSVIAAVLAAVLAGLVAAPATAGHRPDPHFRDVWCAPLDDIKEFESLPKSREGARSYAATAEGDGYQWGGGCWNANRIDDQPNDPVKDSSTGGEGGDCSGFTFKSWFLPIKGTSFSYWAPLKDIHGPYIARSFMSAGPPQTVNVDKSKLLLMDALAKDGHIGMLAVPGASPLNLDLIVEAKSERDGTGVWLRSYRGDRAYKGVRRTGWIVPDPDDPCGILCSEEPIP